MLLTWSTCTTPQSLSADELEELKAEIVAETVAKIAGEVSFACRTSRMGLSVCEEDTRVDPVREGSSTSFDA